jgi:hypothetical protein
MGTFIALDVAIGLVFMYLLLAIICTAINEWIAGLFRLRARNLKKAISKLVDAPETASSDADAESTTPRLSDMIWTHPLVDSLKDGKRAPSYIPAPRFVAAFRDVQDSVRVKPRDADSATRPRPSKAAKDLARVEKQLSALRKTTAPRIRVASLSEAATIRDDPEGDDNDRIEEWFNQGMERASGWYKRRIMFLTIAVAIALTVFSNADTIAAARILWHNPTVRAAVVTQAQERARRARPAESGLFVQADYPDKDKPVADATPGEVEEDNPEDANTAGEDEETSTAGSGITEEEQAALSQILGWSRDFREINRDVCRQRQERMNAACKPGQEASPECRAAVDDGPRGGVCEHIGNGLEPTDRFAPGSSFWPLIWTHLLGWFLTAAAVSMGAPFWFDTLNLFINVRSAGKNPDEKKK